MQEKGLRVLKLGLCGGRPEHKMYIALFIATCSGVKKNFFRCSKLLLTNIYVFVLSEFYCLYYFAVCHPGLLQIGKMCKDNNIPYFSSAREAEKQVS